MTGSGRLACGVAVAANLGLLVWFRYANFLVSQAGGVLADLGVPRLTLPAVLLPIGVSFFTFHRISYVVDVRRGRPALRDPIDLLLYIALLPHLIAGPIVRYGDIAEQLPAENRRVDPASFSEASSASCTGW